MKREINIRALSPNEIESAVNVLSFSFAEESLFEYLLGNDKQERAKSLRGIMRGMIKGHAPYSDIDCAFDGKELIGVAITIRPEYFPIKGKTMLSIAMRFVPQVIKLAFKNPRILRLFRAASLMEKRHPKESCYYMAFFGVHPDFRLGGVAQKLSRYIFNRADRTKFGCYLDTAGNKTMRMCRYLGFEVRHKFKPLKKGPTCWSMWRDPKEL